MSLTFGKLRAGEITFGNLRVAKMYFGNVLIYNKSESSVNVSVVTCDPYNHLFVNVSEDTEFVFYSDKNKNDSAFGEGIYAFYFNFDGITTPPTTNFAPAKPDWDPGIPICPMVTDTNGLAGNIFNSITTNAVVNYDGETIYEWHIPKKTGYIGIAIDSVGQVGQWGQLIKGVKMGIQNDISITNTYFYSTDMDWHSNKYNGTLPQFYGYTTIKYIGKA